MRDDLELYLSYEYTIYLYRILTPYNSCLSSKVCQLPNAKLNLGFPREYVTARS